MKPDADGSAIIAAAADLARRSHHDDVPPALQAFMVDTAQRLRNAHDAMFEWENLHA